MVAQEHLLPAQGQLGEEEVQLGEEVAQVLSTWKLVEPMLSRLHPANPTNPSVAQENCWECVVAGSTLGAHLLVA